MSTITKKDVEHIAGLARIEFSAKEKEKMAGELDTILGYIDKLKDVDTEGVRPVSNITGMENVLRKDEPSNKPRSDVVAGSVNLVEMAPENKDNYVKVKAIFGE